MTSEEDFNTKSCIAFMEKGWVRGAKVGWLNSPKANYTIDSIGWYSVHKNDLGMIDYSYVKDYVDKKGFEDVVLVFIKNDTNKLVCLIADECWLQKSSEEAFNSLKELINNL